MNIARSVRWPKHSTIYSQDGCYFGKKTRNKCMYVRNEGMDDVGWRCRKCGRPWRNIRATTYATSLTSHTCVSKKDLSQAAYTASRCIDGRVKPHSSRNPRFSASRLEGSTKLRGVNARHRVRNSNVSHRTRFRWVLALRVFNKLDRESMPPHSSPYSFLFSINRNRHESRCIILSRGRDRLPWWKSRKVKQANVYVAIFDFWT